MIYFDKKPNSDFVVLNLTDTQLTDCDWHEDNFICKSVKYTSKELVDRIKPDLITLSGDYSYSGQSFSFKKSVELFDSFRIPWAFVWGNHDQQDGGKFIVEEAEKVMTSGKYCIYEVGDLTLGRGNYVIGIKQGERAVSALIMVDTHEMEDYVLPDGTIKNSWSKWTDKQKDWYKCVVAELKKQGYRDSTVISHIPIYAYKQAYEEAFFNGEWGHVRAVSLSESYGDHCWKDGYKDSFGVKYEGYGCPPVDDGMIDLISGLGHTKNYIAGHDHINNYSIVYKGVRLTYATKTGAGCYWDSGLNGGTVITIGGDGVKSIRHEMVDCTAIK
ncbi:MAG: metallophosphoesterase [Clostridia bacterium]|nr:metallophosphoesterase [Clostridia bacterium]